MFRKFSFLFIVLFFFTACAGMTVPKVDPTAYPIDKGPREAVPKVCRASYESVFPRVAVVNFTNNTTFDYANVVQATVSGTGQRTAVGGAAVGVVPGAAGVVWGTKEKTQFQRDSQRTERQINAKLSESVEDGVMDEMVNMGGAKIFTRKEMEKIFSEHKFQQSGLTDESTLVRLGKLAGVKYIITGSVNNVDLTYKTFESARKGLDKGGSGSWGLDLLGSAIAAGLESQEGWNISTDVALRILEVETGEVLLSKVVRGKHIIGKTPYPNYDALIGGIKKAASKGLGDARPQLSKWFTVKGYVRQLRTSPDGKERVASLNIGEKMGIKSGSKLLVYTFEELEDEDPVTGKKTVTCNMFKLPVELTVTDQIQAESSWTKIDGKPEDIKRVKVGQLVERKPMK